MDIRAKLKDFIVTEYLPGDNIGELHDEINLIENGIMDSLAVLKLVAFMENEFNISLAPEEIDMDNLNSIRSIVAIVEEKISRAA